MASFATDTSTEAFAYARQERLCYDMLKSEKLCIIEISIPMHNRMWSRAVATSKYEVHMAVASEFKVDNSAGLDLLDVKGRGGDKAKERNEEGAGGTGN